MSRVFLTLGASHTSLELIMVSLHLSHLVLMESTSIYHGCWRRIEAFEKGLAFETKLRTNHG